MRREIVAVVCAGLLILGCNSTGAQVGPRQTSQTAAQPQMNGYWFTHGSDTALDVWALQSGESVRGWGTIVIGDSSWIVGVDGTNIYPNVSLSLIRDPHAPYQSSLSASYFNGSFVDSLKMSGTMHVYKFGDFPIQVSRDPSPLPVVAGRGR